MARLMFLVALCVLPAIASAARVLSSTALPHFYVEGKVYCDTCKAGFETPASTYMKDATVKIECKKTNTLNVVYSKEGVTDAHGKYHIDVDTDHPGEICDVVLVRSAQANCNKASAGRERARIILTNNNGIASENRFANSMGFEMETALPACQKIMQQYQLNDDDDV